MIGMGREIQRTPQMAQTGREVGRLTAIVISLLMSQHFEIFLCSSSKMIMKHFLQHLRL